MSIVDTLKKIAGWFQPNYDALKAMKWSPAQQELIDSIWDNLAPTIQKALWSLVALILAKYGPEAAQSLLATVLSEIRKKGWVIEG